MSIYRPYVYLIGWSKLNVWYYGARYAKNANPDDLWVTYFTSSRKVKDFRKLHGEPDITEVRRTFSTAESTRLWEFNVIRRMNCVKDQRFLNAGNAGQSFYNAGPMSDEARSKMSRARTGKTGYKHTEEAKRKISQSQLGCKRYKHTLEARSKMSAALKGKKHTPEQKSKMSEAKIGKKLSTEHKAAIKSSWERRKLAKISNQND